MWLLWKTSEHGLFMRLVMCWPVIFLDNTRTAIAVEDLGGRDKIWPAQVTEFLSWNMSAADDLIEI